MTEFSALLASIDQGNPNAVAELWALVYDELRQLAARQMAHEAPDHTLQPTALVNEAYLRMVGQEGKQNWQNRRHFFAAAAEAMRRILIDNARRKQATKRGGELRRHTLDDSLLQVAEQLHNTADPAELLAVDEALDRLAAAEPQVAELVRLRYFAGLTIPQAAATLGISPRTADAWWAYARAWLLGELHDKDA